jgi:hypothetical protein
MSPNKQKLIINTGNKTLDAMAQDADIASKNQIEAKYIDLRQVESGNSIKPGELVVMKEGQDVILSGKMKLYVINKETGMASQITNVPAGSVSSINLQAAIDELALEPSERTTIVSTVGCPRESRISRENIFFILLIFRDNY